MKFEKIFLGDLDFTFAVEILIRTLFMFIMILVVLRLSGKRGVRQLSLFEVAIIIGLGSAAGDPMFNEDIAILPALIVFASILALYRTITYFAAKSDKFEELVEGAPMYIIENGVFVLKATGNTSFARDEFFAEMRQQSIDHVGQVKTAILETNGMISFYYFQDDQVKFGLPVLPKAYNERTRIIDHAGEYACISCAHTQHIEQGHNKCIRCEKDEWVPAVDSKRVK